MPLSKDTRQRGLRCGFWALGRGWNAGMHDRGIAHLPRRRQHRSPQQKRMTLDPVTALVIAAACLRRRPCKMRSWPDPGLGFAGRLGWDRLAGRLPDPPGSRSPAGHLSYFHPAVCYSGAWFLRPETDADFISFCRLGCRVKQAAPSGVLVACLSCV